MDAGDRARAEKALQSDLKKYLPLWERCIPPDFKDVHKWDYTRFTRGERFVFQPIPRSEFDQTLEQVKRWDLDQYLKEKSFDKLTYRVKLTVPSDVAARHASLLKGGLTGMGHVRVAQRVVEPEWPEPATEESRRVSAWR